MPKKIAIIFLYTVVIAIVALFAVNEVRAFSDEPCYGLNYDGDCPEPLMSLEKGGWQISLQPVTETGMGSGLYDWHYVVKNESTGTASGANFLAMLIPDCCTNPKITVDLVQSILFKDYFAVAQGEPTVKFGKYNEQARVAKGTADNTINWHLITNTNVMTSSTILLSVKKLGVLTFEMAVPGCELASPPLVAPIGARTFTECANFGQETTEDYYIGDELILATSDDVSFKIVRSSDQEGCIKTLSKHEGLECPGDGELVDPEATLPDEYVLQASFLRTCPDENISVTQGSPFYLYKFYSGGVLYQMCLNLLTGHWTSIGCCTGACP